MEFQRGVAGAARGDIESTWEGWDKIGTAPFASPSPTIRQFRTLQLDVDTRWTSVLNMLLSFKHNIAALDLALANDPALLDEYEDEMPTVDDVLRLDATISVLQPFDAATQLFCGDHYSTLCLVPHTVNGLYSLLLPTDQDNGYARPLRAAMYKLFRFKFEPLFRVPNLCLMAAYLHPLYCAHLLYDGYVEGDALENVKRLIVQEAVGIGDIAETDYDSDSDIVAATGPQEDTVIRELNMYTTSIEQKKVDGITDSITKWEALGRTDDDYGVYWWKKQEKAQALMSLVPVARMLLAIPASTVASERSFSRAGDIDSSKRGSLGPELFSDLLFIAKNAPEIGQFEEFFSLLRRCNEEEMEWLMRLGAIDSDDGSSSGDE